MSATSGENTTVVPPRSRAGNANVRDFPPPVARMPSASRPASTALMSSCWPGRNASWPKTPRSSSSARPPTGRQLAPPLTWDPARVVDGSMMHVRASPPKVASDYCRKRPGSLPDESRCITSALPRQRPARRRRRGPINVIVRKRRFFTRRSNCIGERSSQISRAVTTLPRCQVSSSTRLRHSYVVESFRMDLCGFSAMTAPKAALCLFRARGVASARHALVVGCVTLQRISWTA
jgi:hypothetical protein